MGFRQGWVDSALEKDGYSSCSKKMIEVALVSQPADAG